MCFSIYTVPKNSSLNIFLDEIITTSRRYFIGKLNSNIDIVCKGLGTDQLEWL